MAGIQQHQKYVLDPKNIKTSFDRIYNIYLTHEFSV